MLKRCSCGSIKHLGLRNVHYAKKVHIAHVPVYSCDSCGSNEVFPGVKADLSALIGSLGPKPPGQKIWFDELHEWAGVLRHAEKHTSPLSPMTVAKVMEERTNDLLDMLLIAASVGDEGWQTELRSRLSQLSGQVGSR